ncbi:PTS sugar transporter subunit IIA [Balneolaceae bacterium YR4-1]|uniref:PTS sugar transporter subunit IIA n=1 Tax=Halalkalibaculum roseum TaxID=2709311 RepID=A0A6M1SY30_9BACT|nr:PTS sugar transporter subunit IIA [Halalkalibaculum roseum]NGP76866.1 PTS sugar transporter subunit IIA [Halalkalibaculum roseum]
MNIVSLLDKSTVIPDLKASSKKEVLNELISSLSSKVDSDELDAIHQAVFEREKIMSTGVGKGLAIPHGKASGIKDNYAAFALLDSPVEYEAIDGQPVTMVFLLVGPQSSNSFHIKMLSRISRLMNNSEFRTELNDCKTAEEILEVFNREEETHFGS